MSSGAHILIIEDDPTFCALLAEILEQEGYRVTTRDNGRAGLMCLQRHACDLVLSDLRLPEMNGLEVYRAAREQGIAPPFIVLTAFGTVEEAVAAMKEGVEDFLTKPLKTPDEVRQIVAKALKHEQHSRTLRVMQQREADGLPPDQVLFAGSAMAPVRELLSQVANTPATVLISGESGTGKELAARTIHAWSDRHAGPFVAINCAAIPDQLLESELFGHEKGAFTGALQSRPGKFELASGGTLFLDEIGELPLSLQAKLLRVVQERVYERVGGTRVLKADVRIVAATNQDLPVLVKEKKFREDLYYRLQVFPIMLPALRERLDGLDLLVDWLLARACAVTGKPVPPVEPSAREQLQRYRWPGNIRELQNIIERSVIVAKGPISSFPLPIQLPEQSLDSGGVLRNRERESILEVLTSCGNNRRMAAERLGISLRTLQYRLKEYGLV